MATNPFDSTTDTVGPPYSHAHVVDLDALALGDVDLPFVTSALWVGHTSRCHLRVTMLGGQTISLEVDGTHCLPIRVTRIHRSDGEEGVSQPYTIIALW